MPMKDGLIIGHPKVLENVYLIWLNGCLTVPIKDFYTIDFVLNGVINEPDIYEWSKTNINILTLSGEQFAEVLKLQQFYKMAITLTETMAFYFAQRDSFSLLAPDEFFSESTMTCTYYGVGIIHQNYIIRKEAAM